MHRHVGDERPRRDIAGGVAAEQRLSEHRARQLYDVEAGLRQRNADDFEFLALGRKRELQRLALPGE